MDHYNQSRKNFILPGTLNTDKVLGTDLNYKQLSEYLAWGTGLLYMLAGLSAVMAERASASLLLIFLQTVLLVTKDNPWAK